MASDAGGRTLRGRRALFLLLYPKSVAGPDGGSMPQCRKPVLVSMRPRGVRMMNPRMMS
jgi:hypothetical protein